MKAIIVIAQVCYPNVIGKSVFRCWVIHLCVSSIAAYAKKRSYYARTFQRNETACQIIHHFDRVEWRETSFVVTIFSFRLLYWTPFKQGLILYGRPGSKFSLRVDQRLCGKHNTSLAVLLPRVAKNIYWCATFLTSVFVLSDPPADVFETFFIPCQTLMAVYYVFTLDVHMYPS